MTDDLIQHFFKIWNLTVLLAICCFDLCCSTKIFAQSQYSHHKFCNLFRCHQSMAISKHVNFRVMIFYISNFPLNFPLKILYV